MKYVKKFNENVNDDNENIKTIKVKHLIEYLRNLNPEAEVILDKDGWDESGELDEVKMISSSYLFQYEDEGFYKDEPTLFINN